MPPRWEDNIIPKNVYHEIDFMLGSVEECNSPLMVEALGKHDIHPDGGWIDIETLPDEVIYSIYEDLFLSGILTPFFTETEED